MANIAVNITYEGFLFIECIIIQGLHSRITRH